MIKNSEDRSRNFIDFEDIKILKILNVGLVIFSLISRPSANPCKKVVFPPPKSPFRATTKALLWLCKFFKIF